MRRITNVQLSQSTGWGIRIESQTHFCFVDPDLTGLQFPDLNTGEKIMNHKYLWHLWGTGTPCLLCDSQPPTCVLRSNFRSPCASLGILTGLVSCFHVLTPPDTPKVQGGVTEVTATIRNLPSRWMWVLLWLGNVTNPTLQPPIGERIGLRSESA